MEANHTPLVSVVIPAYNAQAFLKQTLETVFAQTFTDYEVVVVDDESKDGTREILAPLAKAGRIRLIEQRNGGVGNARNRGIDEARGKYVALLDHDDLWIPEKLEVQVAFAKKHPECSMVLVPWVISTAPERWMFNRDCVDAEGIVERLFLKAALGNSLICSSVLFFEKSRAAGLRYGEDRACIEDQEFHIGLAARGKVGVAGDRPLMIYQWHDSNTSSQARYWYNGIIRLRRLDREGRFTEYTGVGREDLLKFLAHMARTATSSQLLSGERMAAMTIYAREILHQSRERRWKYLASVPILACAPAKVIRKAFSQQAARTEA